MFGRNQKDSRIANTIKWAAEKFKWRTFKNRLDVYKICLRNCCLETKSDFTWIKQPTAIRLLGNPKRSLLKA